MPDHRSVVHAHMRSLVGGFGCLDAAVGTINAHWGCNTCKGTLSKKMSGQLDWSVADIIAFENALGKYPVTQLLANRLEAQEEAGPGCKIEAAGQIAIESGEAVEALLTATRKSQADVLKELDDVGAAIESAKNIIKAEMELGEVTIPRKIGVIS